MSYTGPGKLSISRRTSSQRDPFFVLTIEDAVSGEEIEVKIEAAQLAHALGGAAAQSCDITIHHLARIGKKHEHKTEIVSCAWNATEEQKAAALAPFEVDGWMGNVDDIGNHHRQTGGGYSVTFHRWVDVGVASIPAPKKGRKK